MSLESKVDSSSKVPFSTKAKLFAVDVASAWIYYTPMYAIQELACGKDPETVLKTRLLGCAVHAVVMRPTGMLRNYFANKWNVTKKSSFIDQSKVNIAGVIPIQAVAYSAMLYAGMAWSGNYDWKASAYAFGVGLAIGLVHAPIYGKAQDKFRRLFGVKPAIK
jgi:hypothetical protein